jgi:copper chaperone CopZ
MKNTITAIFILFIFVNTANSKFIKNISNTSKIMIEITLAEKTIKIKCTEMSCDACKRSITKSINQLEGIKKLDIDLESKIITVVIDDSRTDEQSVLNAVIGAGYDAELIN